MRPDINERLAPGEDAEWSSPLRGLPARIPPAQVRTSLRILASRERQRALRRGSVRNALSAWSSRFHLSVDNIMRPLALPFAGGLFSAVALFSVWLVPTYRVAQAGGSDVPTMLSTQAEVKRMIPISVSGPDVDVDVGVDDQGHMVDYNVVGGGANNLSDPAQRHSVENMLLFTEFVPATAFGKPTSGRIRLSLRSSRIDVKG